jgi:hypothetical protein
MSVCADIPSSGASHFRPTKPVALLTADWHLQPSTWTGRPEIAGDSYRSARLVVALAVERRVPLVVLGDVLNVRHPDPVSIGVLFACVDACRDAGLPFYYLQGQHELHRQRPWLSCHPWPTHVHDTELDLGPIRCYALDWLPAEQLAPKLAGIADRDVAMFLGHQVWTERMGKRAAIRGGTDAAFADVPKIGLLASGDFHGHKATNHDGKDGQRLMALSPGSIYLKSIDEDPLKFCYELHDDGSFVSRSIGPLRPLHRARFHDEAGLAVLVERTGDLAALDPADPDKPILQVLGVPNSFDAHARLSAAAEGRVHLFFRTVDPEEGDGVEAARREESSRPTRLVDFVDRACPVDSDVYRISVRLLSSPDPKGELDSLTREVLTSPPA